jgi:antitoxin HicB
MEYPITLTRDDNHTWLVSFPDFPEAHTFGTDTADALRHAPDALATVLDAYIKDRRDIPAPSAGAANHSVTVPALMEAKIALYRAMRAARIGKSELGRRLDWHLPQIDRLLAMTHGSKLEQLEAAFAALGKRLELRVSEASAPPRKADPVAPTLDAQLQRLSPARRRRVAVRAQTLINVELARQKQHRTPPSRRARRRVA